MADRAVWKRRLVVYGSAAVALLAGNWIFDRLSHRRAGAQAVTAFTDMPGAETCASWAPDGRRVAFCWKSDEGDARYRIYVKPAAGGAAGPLTSGQGEEWAPAWSPDGSRIAFTRVDGERGGYYVVPAGGGAERALAEFNEAPSERYPPSVAWLPDGRRVAAPWQEDGKPAGIFLLGVDGVRTRLTTPPSSARADESPAVSPDGRSVAFVRRGSEDAGDIFVVPAPGGEPLRITFGEKRLAGLSWTPDSREIVFASARLDGLRLWRVSASGGTPRQLDFAGEGASYPAVSRAGKLLFTRTAPDANIWRVDLRDPKHPARRLISSPRREWAAQYSPDGRRIAFVSDRSGSDQLWTCDSEGRHPVPVTSLNVLLGEPKWSPDGSRILFMRRGMQPGLYVVPSGGGTARQFSPANVAFAFSGNWSRDGRSIYFFGEGRLWKVPADGGRATPITRHPGFAPVEAPDGKVYYHWAGRVWKTDENEEGGEAVSDFLRPLDAQFWALAKTGIYYVEEERGEAGRALRFYDFQKREAHEVVILEHLRRGDPTFAISPDERYALYTKGEETTDLMATELK